MWRDSDGAYGLRVGCNFFILSYVRNGFAEQIRTAYTFTRICYCLSALMMLFERLA